MSYGNAIAVHPADPKIVICGGVDLHVTKNGGATWRVASHGTPIAARPTYAHADHHALVMPASAPGRVYSANDGGVDRSDDGGTAWSNRSDGLAVTMFYDIDCAQTDRSAVRRRRAGQRHAHHPGRAGRTRSSSCSVVTAAG